MRCGRRRSRRSNRAVPRFQGQSSDRMPDHAADPVLDGSPHAHKGASGVNDGPASSERPIRYARHPHGFGVQGDQSSPAGRHGGKPGELASSGREQVQTHMDTDGIDQPWTGWHGDRDAGGLDLAHPKTNQVAQRRQRSGSTSQRTDSIDAWNGRGSGIGNGASHGLAVRRPRPASRVSGLEGHTRWLAVAGDRHGHTLRPAARGSCGFGPKAASGSPSKRAPAHCRHSWGNSFRPASGGTSAWRWTVRHSPSSRLNTWVARSV